MSFVCGGGLFTEIHTINDTKHSARYQALAMYVY